MTRLYVGGEPATAVQGAEYTDALYKAGSSTTITKQGSEFTSSSGIYYGGSSRTFKLRGDAYSGSLYTTSSVSVTPIGAKCPHSYMYYLSGGEYYGMSMSNYYKAGTTQTYYTRSAVGSTLYYSGGDTTVSLQGLEIGSKLYKAGSSVTYTAQGSKVTEKLYKAGASYSDGLCTGYTASSAKNAELKLATFSTKEVTALTT